MTQTSAHQTYCGNERRSERRNRVLKAGVILFNKGYASFSCKVRNLTDNGALLELGQTDGIPSQFDFRMNGEGTSSPAHIVWRSRDRLGIRFS